MFIEPIYSGCTDGRYYLKLAPLFTLCNVRHMQMLCRLSTPFCNVMTEERGEIVKYVLICTYFANNLSMLVCHLYTTGPTGYSGHYISRYIWNLTFMPSNVLIGFWWLAIKLYGWSQRFIEIQRSYLMLHEYLLWINLAITIPLLYEQKAYNKTQILFMKTVLYCFMLINFPNVFLIAYWENKPAPVRLNSWCWRGRITYVY